MTEHDKDSSKLPVATDETLDKSDASPEVESSTQDEALSTDKERSKQRVPLVAVIIIVLVVLLAGTGAGGYWVWLQMQQQMTEISTQSQVLGEELQAMQARLTRLQTENQTIDNDWHVAVKELEALVVQSAQRLNAQANRTENRWPLEEALTLTRLANQRLQLDASAAVATGLLKSADVILSKQDQAAVLPIRRQIAADILALQKTSAADVNGLYFQLEAVSGELKELVWVPKTTTQTDIPENTDPASGFWHSLKQVVVVSRLDVPMQAPPLQSDFERWRQHTLMSIEQTQLALLARNQPLFDAALQQSLDQLTLMNSQFDFTALNATLRAMEQAQLNPQWPDVNASITALEVYLSEQVASESDATAEEGAE